MPKKSGSRQSRLDVFVALLRGVNVGGKNIISMRALKESFEKSGFTQVSTYINSGNVIFTSKEADPRKLEKKIEQILSKEYQLDGKVVVRSVAEMAKLVESLPATWTGDSQYRYNVMFLRHTIDSEKILDDMPIKPETEELQYRPGTLLWSAQATEFNQTSLAKLSSRKIFQDMTVRNLNTTKKLYELMKKVGEADK
jgi:uncharacterized protein (DUF1697 family)